MLLGDAAAGLDLESLQGMQFPAEMSFLRLPHVAGSNAFAVSGQKSATGGALLMGEFHMQSGRLPPVLYAAHIEYPNGEYYQGVGMPGLCFLAAGRTSRVAWSYTYGHADNVDVLVEECQGGRYRRGTTGNHSPAASNVFPFADEEPRSGSTSKTSTAPRRGATRCPTVVDHSSAGQGCASRLPT